MRRPPRNDFGEAQQSVTPSPEPAWNRIRAIDNLVSLHAADVD